MSFLKDLTSSLKTSLTKSAQNAYQTTLDKAQTAANNLFTKLTAGTGADFKAGTIPATATPSGPSAPLPASPTIPASISSAAESGNSYSGKVFVFVLLILAFFYFQKD